MQDCALTILLGRGLVSPRAGSGFVFEPVFVSRSGGRVLDNGLTVYSVPFDSSGVSLLITRLSLLARATRSRKASRDSPTSSST